MDVFLKKLFEIPGIMQIVRIFVLGFLQLERLPHRSVRRSWVDLDGYSFSQIWNRRRVLVSSRFIYTEPYNYYRIQCKYYDKGNLKWIYKQQKGYIVEARYYEDGATEMYRITKYGIANHYEWYPDGTPRVEVENAKTDKAFSKHWYPNGKLHMVYGSLHDHNLHGLMIKWNDKGSVVSIREYDNGKCQCCYAAHGDIVGVDWDPLTRFN